MTGCVVFRSRSVRKAHLALAPHFERTRFGALSSSWKLDWLWLRRRPLSARDLFSASEKNDLRQI